MEDNKVKTVSEFLSQINQKISSLSKRTSTSLFAFRGEGKIYQTSGMPNIFRETMASKSFEKNILDEVISNGLSKGDNYLHVAIDAQHGGFPSRLLDITFNSIIALFFAVTPHFTKEKNSGDNEDGVVIIYAIEKMFSADSKQTQEKYINQIDGKGNILDGYNHIFLDHTKRNTRISAQYGGFVMFSGSKFIPIPEFCQEKIIIDRGAKEKLREQLKNVFGLTMSTIYPESDNFVEYLKEKANILSNEISYSDLNQLLNTFSRELDYRVQTIINNVEVIEVNKYRKIDNVQEILNLEKYILDFIYSYRDDRPGISEINEKINTIINNCIFRINNFFYKQGLEFDVMSNHDFFKEDI